MRRYLKIKPATLRASKPAVTYPGYTLAEIIDEFFAEGVVPEFLPADLGEDGSEEVTDDGFFAVDPDGDIRTDPMARREANLLAGITDPDPAPNPTPPAPAPVPEPTE